MLVHVVSHTEGLLGIHLSRWTVVIIDVVRASTTMAQALAAGCHRIIPVGTVPEARALRASLRDANPLLGGERGGLPMPGFDLGNSPRQYTPEAVSGRTVVFTTTNGTRAIQACRGAARVLIGAFVNMTAVADHLSALGGQVLLLPVGKEGEPVLDDVVCAGMYAHVLSRRPGVRITGEAQLARLAYWGYRSRLLDAVRESPSGQALEEVGLGEDLPFCAHLDLLETVPMVTRGEVRAVDGV